MEEYAFEATSWIERCPIIRLRFIEVNNPTRIVLLPTVITVRYVNSTTDLVFGTIFFVRVRDLQTIKSSEARCLIRTPAHLEGPRKRVFVKIANGKRVDAPPRLQHGLQERIGQQPLLHLQKSRTMFKRQEAPLRTDSFFGARKRVAMLKRQRKVSDCRSLSSGPRPSSLPHPALPGMVLLCSSSSKSPFHPK
jgi:hypothetical protein